MISLKKINTQKVNKIPIPDEDTRPIKGHDICEEVFANIFLCAKKKSGKTSALFKILKECVVKKTIIVIFCSTAYKDECWIQIRKYFTNKDMDIRVYTSIFEDGEDQLSNLIEDLKQEAKDEEDKANEEPEDEVDKCDDILERLKYMDKPQDEESQRKKENIENVNTRLLNM